MHSTMTSGTISVQEERKPREATYISMLGGTLSFIKNNLLVYEIEHHMRKINMLIGSLLVDNTNYIT